MVTTSSYMKLLVKEINMPKLGLICSNINVAYICNFFLIFFFLDCGSVQGISHLEIISPGDSSPVLTWCDQDKGSSSWTVIQRRKDGSVKFNRPWNDYVQGFGSPTGK